MRKKLKKKKRSQLQEKISNVKSVIGKVLKISTEEKFDVNKLHKGKNSFEEHLKKLYEIFDLRSKVNLMEIKLMEQEVLKSILGSIDKKTVSKDSLFFRSKAYKEFYECSKQLSSGNSDEVPLGQSIHIGVNVNNETKQLGQYSLEELRGRELTLTRQLKLIKGKKEDT